MKLMIRITSLFLLLTLLGSQSVAQDEKSLFDKIDAVTTDSLNEAAQGDKGAQLHAIEELLNKRLDVEANSEYQKFVEMHHKRTFTWQYYATILIFITVMLIVYSGLVLSFLHFKNDLRSKKESESKIEIGASGLKLRSSVIGLVILALSLGFFYLYLSHAFEIKMI